MAAVVRTTLTTVITERALKTLQGILAKHVRPPRGTRGILQVPPAVKTSPHAAAGWSSRGHLSRSYKQTVAALGSAYVYITPL